MCDRGIEDERKALREFQKLAKATFKAYSELEASYDKLLEDYNELVADYNALLADYNALQGE
jgi:hypothetical protein